MGVCVRNKGVMQGQVLEFNRHSQSLIRVSGKNGVCQTTPREGFFIPPFSQETNTSLPNLYVFFPLCVSIHSLRAKMKKNKGKEVVVGVEERKVVWSVLHTNRVSHQKKILMDGERAVE